MAVTIDAAQGSRLFSVRPANTSDTDAFEATLQTELTKLFVCNNTGGALTFRLHHVLAGGSASLDNALYYDKSVAANDTLIFGGDTPNGGIHMAEGDKLVVRSSSGNGLAFNGYGVTATIAPENL